MIWKPADFLTARRSGPTKMPGYVHLGLGLYREPLSVSPVWTLVHLGSGHSLCQIAGKVAEAFPIATEIAECGDWDWDGLSGYVNRDPEILKRAAEIIAKHNRCSRRENYSNESERIAREIAIERAG